MEKKKIITLLTLGPRGPLYPVTPGSPFWPYIHKGSFVYINKQDMPMCCLTFFKSCSELQLLNSIFLSTGPVPLGVLGRRKQEKQLCTDFYFC